MAMIPSKSPPTSLKKLLLLITFVTIVLWGTRYTTSTAGSVKVPVTSPLSTLSSSSQHTNTYGILGEQQEMFSQLKDNVNEKQLHPRPNFQPGIPKPPGSNYSRALIVPRLKEENSDWIREELRDVDAAIYVVDDPKSPYHPPKNKGHEVMVYLTYIIDHYEALPDIMMFMHSHQISWHNEEPLEFDAAMMVKRLSSDHVTREGFMNMRCHWGPGCPDWMHPRGEGGDANKKEETLIAQSWSELFPFDPVPEVLAQPCCAQFALSRDRVITLPKSRYIFYRDWLLRTELDDYISGRVWEYLWQVVFTGKGVVCPDQRICYCDGYGLCFDEKDFDQFQGLIFQMREVRGDFDSWKAKNEAIKTARINGNFEELAKLEVPEEGKDKELIKELVNKRALFFSMRDAGLERGDDPKTRAEMVGRPWKENIYT